MKTMAEPYRDVRLVPVVVEEAVEGAGSAVGNRGGEMVVGETESFVTDISKGDRVKVSIPLVMYIANSLS